MSETNTPGPAGTPEPKPAEPVKSGGADPLAEAEKAAKIAAAKALAAEKKAATASAAAAEPVITNAPVPAAAAPAAAGTDDEKAAKIAAAKAAAAEKAKAALAAKAAAAPATEGAAPAAPAAPVKPAIPPGTPEALALAAAAHQAAGGDTGINKIGTPANKPAKEHLAAAKPAAPAAAKAKAPEGVLPKPPELQTRRSFVEWGIAVWTIFFIWLAGIGHLFLRFMFPNVLYESDPKFIAGKKTDFPEPNKVYENYKQAQAIWLVRLSEEGQDRLVALSTVCTHLGCTPNWLEAEQKFKCPCHGSGYYLNGVNFEGPTPRPLERFRIFVDATGSIVVDKSKKYRQDLQQWNENESFLSMS